MKKMLSDHDKFRMASDDKTEIEFLIELSKDDNEEIRAAVAYNKSTPIECIIELSKDISDYVKECVKSRDISIKEISIYSNTSGFNLH